GAIAAVGEVMAAEWNAEFAGTMLNSGPDNDAYRSDAEALQDILQAAATQMELTGTQKLAAVVRYSPEAARPKRAAFWRSGQTLPMVSANVATVRSILEGGVGDLLEDDVSLRGALFELSQIDRALTPLLEDGRPFVELAVDPDAHRRLAFAVSPAAAAQALIAERIQGALGLVAGFNALDGD
ncbi:MAG: imelysin family protein, partial [Pseudomonadota bacterium]